jgi:hypothetical protein
VFATIDQQSLLIVVLFIKNGKTLTFVLLVVLRDPGVTIVIILFNILKKDYIRRL